MFQLQLRDNDDTLVAYIHNKVTKISWDWNRIGGCGSCQFQLREAYDGSIADNLQEDYSIRAYLSGTLWYSGVIDKVTPSVTGQAETINVTALGYVNQLKRIIVPEKTYTDQEISAIARNVAEVYATAHTDVVSAAANYDNTKYTADSIYFNESVFDCITKLADIAGRREWGVDADKNLFFKERDDTIQHYFNIKKDFVQFRPIKDFNPIITKIYLLGSDGYKQTFTVTNKITLREATVSNASITTASVGSQFARMYLKEKGRTVRSYVGKQIGRTTRVEATIPIGRALMSPKKNVNYLYDVATQLYDSGLKYNGGDEYLQIEKIKYTLTDMGVNATLYLGPVPPSLADRLGQLEYEIANERIQI